MGLPITKEKRYTVEEYFALSEAAEERYEFEYGELVAMGRTTDTHEDLAFNAKTILKRATRKKGCKVHQESVALEVEEKGKYYLPDVMLTCDERDHANRDIKRYPGLVIEVVSKSSVKRDRDEKFKAYFSLPSLKYYLLLSQDQVKVEVFEKREGQKGWIYDFFTEMTDVMELEQLDIQLKVGDIYDDVELIPDQQDQQSQKD